MVNMQPCTFRPNTVEYRNLVAVAKMLEAISTNGTKYDVEDVYFDYGQDWVWTTICSPSCQVLNPNEWNMIIFAETANDLAGAVNAITSGKFFRDK